MRYLELTPNVARFFAANILSAPPQKGFSAQETRLAIKVADKLEPIVNAGEGGTLALEDQEHAFAVQWMNEQRFVHAMRETVELQDVIANAPSEPPLKAVEDAA